MGDAILTTGLRVINVVMGAIFRLLGIAAVGGWKLAQKAMAKSKESTK